LAAHRRAAERAWQQADLPADVAQALACIHARLFEEELNVALVRDECGLLNHNISCRFKRAVGIGMRQYIERERLKAAEQLLHHDELSVLDIAWSVGYAYPETFERTFRRLQGCTPTQFRQRCGKTEG
jgi:two-component system response regulator YesN